MAERVRVIPSPQHLEVLDGVFTLRGARVEAQGEGAALHEVARNAQTWLRHLTGAQDGQGAIRVVLELTDAAPERFPEAYGLRVEKDEVRILAAGTPGLVYGVQTLLQLAEPSEGLEVPRVTVDDRPLLALRAVHLDLRAQCLMPTFDYLLETIKELARCKVNAIVLEWEDKFPYQQHPEVASAQALTPDQVRTLFAVSAAYQVQIIPLLQTLGHVEYIVRHPRYAALRERVGDLSQFCPCEPGSLALISELLDELLTAHPDAAFVHLGGDETWLLGSCPRCAAKAVDQGLLAVYVDYIAPLCRQVLAVGKLPIIWGDVLLGEHVDSSHGDGWLTDESTLLAGQPREVRMMYWDYHGVQPADFVHFETYRRHGFTVWVAPTTRYGDIVPDYATHLPNIGAFMEAGIAHGAEGALITSWAWKNMPFEMTWHGLLCGAERAWAGGRLAQNDLDAAAVRLFHGTALPGVVEALYLLSYDYWATSYKDAQGQPIQSSYLSRNPGHEYAIPQPEQVRANARRAHDLLVAA